MKNDVISLLQSEGFLAKLNDASTPEEVCEIFSKEGYEISFEKAKVIMDTMKVVNKRIRNNEEVSDKELEKIAGGRENIIIIRRLEEIIIYSDITGKPDARKPMPPVPGKLGPNSPEPPTLNKPVTLPAPPNPRPVVDCKGQEAQDEIVKWFNQ